MAKIIKLVCATDDGVNFSKEHFGSAKKYLFYSLNLETGETTFIKEIENITPEERIHGDPKKAEAISKIIGDAQVLINSAFGPNLIRMKKKFVIIFSKELNIQKSLKKIKNILDKLDLFLNQVGDKDIIVLK